MNCSKCKELKDIKKFCPNVILKGRGQCKPCMNEVQRDRRKRTCNAGDKKYYNNNLDKCKESRKRYMSSIEAKEKKRISRQLWRHNQRKNNVNYKFQENLRKRLWKIIKYRREKSSKELLGCSLTFYNIWLQYTFDEKMSFENYGSYWDIDHVIGLNNYDLSNKEELSESFHWSNTRALEKSENYRKSDNIICSYIENNNKQLEQFNKIHDFKKSLTNILTEMGNPQGILKRNFQTPSTTK